MTTTTRSHSQLTIVPLGAGDLIDRAVRFYRQNFSTFVLIAAPPVVIGTVLSLLWLQLLRELFFSGGFDPVESVAYVVFAFFGTVIIWFTETVATLMVMGGASRNFVRHLLFGEPISFVSTYKNIRGKGTALFAASAIIAIVLGIYGIFVFYFGLFAAVMVVSIVVLILNSVPLLAAVIGGVLGLAIVLGTFWLFCLLASRFAYVPQVMLVEGQGVFAAIGRSMSLASGNVKRFAVLFAFTTLATYSALAILYIPLGWYAWYAGVDLTPFTETIAPAWYEIASKIVWQASFVMMSPVWMVGLCLLYVDERVRHEGYDIELMAAAKLGEIPKVPQSYINPLHPALGSRQAAADPVPQKAGHSSTSPLGLK